MKSLIGSLCLVACGIAASVGPASAYDVSHYKCPEGYVKNVLSNYCEGPFGAYVTYRDGMNGGFVHSHHHRHHWHAKRHHHHRHH